MGDNCIVLKKKKKKVKTSFTANDILMGMDITRLNVFNVEKY